MTLLISHRSRFAAALVLGTWLTGSALAQATDPHVDHSMAASPSMSASASNAAYEQANAKMHRDMAVPLTGNADQDFLASMIPHHQGAVDMAEVVLKYGKDPKVRKLAQEILVAQKNEIATMNAWLKEMQAGK